MSNSPSLHGLKIGTNIINLGHSRLLWLQDLDGVGGNQPSHLAVGVIDVPKDPGPGRTCIHTGWFETSVHPVKAEVALLDIPFKGIDISDIIWTGIDTILAADATVLIYHYNPVISPVSGLCRAVLEAYGILAIVA